MPCWLPQCIFCGAWITIEHICKVVCDYVKLSEEKFYSSRRIREGGREYEISDIET